jgi:uncharacterized protein
VSDKEKLIEEFTLPGTPVIPAQLEGNAVIQFRCHKDIDCFNACCKNIDIMLTPYDILRLKQRLGMTSSEFLRQYTEPFEFASNSIGGVKYQPKEGTSECQFVTDEGCSVYEDRPTACRYYPVGLLSTRRQDENFDRASYALVREDHCHGHFEDRQLTIDEYRGEQGLEEYDEHGRAWRQLILKVKSAGPAIGNMSKTSLKFFFMACYDLDRFREFIKSTGFSTTFDIDPATRDELLSDDMALLRFGDRMIRQIMYGEKSIDLKADALDQHLARRGDRESTVHDDMARPSMAAYEMPLDGEDEEKSK